jgi:GalNAc-alpha-(1->4)-GalNAc-alpha-(1->3)-diNAcBac-PP-undecaprenol alpha-1,4-N-acetyl-D-galactosaminyltransferase
MDKLNNGIKIKVCLAIPSLQAGGMERVMSELAGYFASKHNIEIHLVLYGLSREIFYTLPGSIIIHEPSFRFDKSYRLLNTFKTLIYFRKTIQRIDPDTILSFGEYWNSFVLLALSGLKYPVFISDRCSPEKQFGIFHSFLRKVLYPHAKAIIAQTDKAREIYFARFKHNNIQVIGNPIRTILNTANMEKQNIVLMVGRLIKSKNQDKLIELFLNIQFDDWKLFLVGYDHLKQNNSDRLQALIYQYNAESKVFLEGKQKEVEAYYNMSKIFAFTSISEGFPNAIGEAMAAGLPTVAFNCVAGPSEMINDNHNGFLIPINDYEKFQDKLEVLMKDEDMRTRFGENGREYIKKFSIGSIGDKYLQLILNTNNECITKLN